MITLKVPTNAPNCFLIVNDDGRERLVQADYDFPPTAEAFGWSIADAGNPNCPDAHCDSDGTVRCSTCCTPASEFIGSAQKWLYDHEGATAEDPGYFS